jgi:hypothetical protein
VNVIYRRKHKKGQEEEQAKKRTRRTQKFQRAIVGASLTDIIAKRNMKPEVRKAQREQAIRYDVTLKLMFLHCNGWCVTLHFIGSFKPCVNIQSNL